LRQESWSAISEPGRKALEALIPSTGRTISCAWCSASSRQRLSPGANSRASRR